MTSGKYRYDLIPLYADGKRGYREYVRRDPDPSLVLYGI